MPKKFTTPSINCPQSETPRASKLENEADDWIEWDLRLLIDHYAPLASRSIQVREERNIQTRQFLEFFRINWIATFMNFRSQFVLQELKLQTRLSMCENVQGPIFCWNSCRLWCGPCRHKRLHSQMSSPLGGCGNHLKDVNFSASTTSLSIDTTISQALATSLRQEPAFP